MATKEAVKYSPGPWKLGGDDKSSIHNDFETIADCYTIVGEGNKLANARLIAAAPETLEALRAIRALLIADADYSVCRTDGKAMGLGEQMVIGQMFENADNAIAKAEGRQ